MRLSIVSVVVVLVAWKGKCAESMQVFCKKYYPQGWRFFAKPKAWTCNLRHTNYLCHPMTTADRKQAYLNVIAGKSNYPGWEFQKFTSESTNKHNRNTHSPEQAETSVATEMKQGGIRQLLLCGVLQATECRELSRLQSGKRLEWSCRRHRLANKIENATARAKGKCNTFMERSGIRGCFCREEPETAEWGNEERETIVKRLMVMANKCWDKNLSVLHKGT